MKRWITRRTVATLAWGIASLCAAAFTWRNYVHTRCLAAVLDGDAESLKRAIRLGGDPDRTFRELGRNALHVAVKNNDLDVVRVLLEWGADPDECTCVFSPLAWAVINDNQELFDLVLDAGADPNVSCCEVGRPLVAAMDRGRTGMAERLLAAGADVNGAYRDGRTSLHAAAERGMTDWVDILLERGAVPQSPTLEGDTPLSLAVRNGHMAAARRLASFPGANSDSAALAAAEAQSEKNGDRSFLILLLPESGDVSPGGDTTAGENSRGTQ